MCVHGFHGTADSGSQGLTHYCPRPTDLTLSDGPVGLEIGDTKFRSAMMYLLSQVECANSQGWPSQGWSELRSQKGPSLNQRYNVFEIVQKNHLRMYLDPTSVGY